MEIGRDVKTVKSLSRHTLEQMITLSSEGLLLADAQDPNLPIVYANPAYEGLTGYSAAELTGNSWQLVNRDGEGQPELARLKAAIGRSEACHVTLPDLRKDGTSWFSEVSVEPLFNARGELKYFLCRQKPVASAPLDGADQGDVEVSLLQRELGRARQKIANLNRIDTATGLLRFGYFRELLHRDLAIARREKRCVTLLLFDIVEFEAYRQVFGSKAADSCQRMIGAQVTRVLRRAGDLCARYDDCALVSAVLGQQPNEVQQLADQISDNVRNLGLHNPRAKSGRYVTIRTALIGCKPGANADTATLIERGFKDLRGKDAEADRRAASS